MADAYRHAALLRETFGVDIPALGCVMLDVEPLPVAEWVPSDWAYYARNPEHYWIKGLEAGNHITLLYGLLRNANEIRPAVDEVLAGWELPPVSVSHIGAFLSTFDDEPYSCIVGHIAVTPALLEAHARLSFLPHVDTHPDYRPHLTLGYVHKEHERPAIAAFTQRLDDMSLTPVELNYGREVRRG